MYNGSNYLTEGWDNSTDWTLTFTMYLGTSNGVGVFIKNPVSKSRDNRWIQIANLDTEGLIVVRRDPTTYTTYVLNSTPVTGSKSVTITKATTNGTTQYTVKVGTYSAKTFTHDSLTSGERVVIGNDYWTGTNNVYISNIKVVEM